MTDNVVEQKVELDWVTRLADEVVAEARQRGIDGPIVCASGISPSGPIHLGNFRELITPHLVADEMFADNVQRGILASLPRSVPGAQAVCPNHVPVVIGNAFTCRLRDAGAYTRARVMIVDSDGGFRLRFS